MCVHIIRVWCNVQESDVGRLCSTCERVRNAYKVLDRKLESSQPLGRFMCRNNLGGF
jgi:hypothetical protein